ncbi:MAG: GtrA family protein [Nanoarchaeota archaeon]
MNLLIAKVGWFFNHVTSFGGRAPAVLTRFFRYIVSSGSTLVLDLLILGFFTEIVGLYYLVSVAISYTSSTTVNYFINRNWGFRGTKTKVIKGYVLFLAFGVFGLLLTLFLMWVFVDLVGIHYSLSRIIVAIIEGTILFILNSIFTFRIPLMEMAPYRKAMGKKK